MTSGGRRFSRVLIAGSALAWASLTLLGSELADLALGVTFGTAIGAGVFSLVSAIDRRGRRVADDPDPRYARGGPPG